MIIYSVTVAVDPAVEAGWVDYMLEKHIDDVVRTGCFSKAEFFQVLDPPDARGWKAYCVHYYASDLNDYERYIHEHAAKLRAEVIERFGSAFGATRQVLQSIASDRSS